MTKDRSDGDFDIVFKHVTLPQFLKGKILTPVCRRQEFIPSLVEKNIANYQKCPISNCWRSNPELMVSGKKARD
jgi:hypothetical protein